MNLIWFPKKQKYEIQPVHWHLYSEVYNPQVISPAWSHGDINIIIHEVLAILVNELSLENAYYVSKHCG